MKYLVLSDIHGVVEYSNKIDEIVSREQPDKIILLGDLYHHGFNVDFMSTVNTLNKYKDIILCTRGNCDNDVDVLVSKFKFEDYLKLTINNKIFFFTHGHLFDRIPDEVDIFIFGHLHTSFIKNIDNKLYINTGSLSLPRDNKHSYIVIDNNYITIKDIDNNIIDSVEYNTEV